MSVSDARRKQTLQHSLRIGVGLLAFYAPVPQFLKRNGNAGDGTTDVTAGTNDPEISIKIPDLRLAVGRRIGVEAIEHR
jgi:hypothetical protein